MQCAQRFKDCEATDAVFLPTQEICFHDATRLTLRLMSGERVCVCVPVHACVTLVCVPVHAFGRVFLGWGGRPQFSGTCS